jgi:hypothetical protein
LSISDSEGRVTIEAVGSETPPERKALKIGPELNPFNSVDGLCSKPTPRSCETITRVSSEIRTAPGTASAWIRAALSIVDAV